MQKLIRKIVFGHGLYLCILLLLGGYTFYKEYRNEDEKLKSVLAKDLKGIRVVLKATIEQLKIDVITTTENYPSPQSEKYCNRFIHQGQQTDSLSHWITTGMAGKHKPYFPALKEAYGNQLELAKIYCDKDIEIIKSFSDFNPQIEHLQKFDNSLFWEHAQVASLMNLTASGNYCLRKISGSNCGSIDINIPYLYFDKLNFQDSAWLEGNIVLSANTYYRSRVFPYRKQHHLFLNNQEFPIKNGIAPFHYQFDTPGIHPLQVRWQYNHPETDSVTVFEKTYYVKVDKP